MILFNKPCMTGCGTEYIHQAKDNGAVLSGEIAFDKTLKVPAFATNNAHVRHHSGF